METLSIVVIVLAILLVVATAVALYYATLPPPECPNFEKVISLDYAQPHMLSADKLDKVAMPRKFKLSRHTDGIIYLAFPDSAPRAADMKALREMHITAATDGSILSSSWLFGMAKANGEALTATVSMRFIPPTSLVASWGALPCNGITVYMIKAAKDWIVDVEDTVYTKLVYTDSSNTTLKSVPAYGLTYMTNLFVPILSKGDIGNAGWNMAPLAALPNGLMTQMPFYRRGYTPVQVTPGVYGQLLSNYNTMTAQVMQDTTNVLAYWGNTALPPPTVPEGMKSKYYQRLSSRAFVDGDFENWLWLCSGPVGLQQHIKSDLLWSDRRFTDILVTPQ